MRLQVTQFSCPKRGSSEVEYEDAVASNKTRFRFAVADGASESSFAALWARLLVRAFVRGLVTPITLLGDIEPLQGRWNRLVMSKPLPWYASQKAEAGAFAALVGLTFKGGRARLWQAVAVGDCCLFHLRADGLLKSFPVEAASDFNNRPLLIGSNPNRNGAVMSAVRIEEGQWNVGDTFLLMSDAIAAFFLGEVGEAGRPASAVLDFTATDEGFREWIGGLRADGRLKNDDVSLLRLDLR